MEPWLAIYHCQRKVYFTQNRCNLLIILHLAALHIHIGILERGSKFVYKVILQFFSLFLHCLCRTATCVRGRWPSAAACRHWRISSEYCHIHIFHFLINLHIIMYFILLAIKQIGSCRIFAAAGLSASQPNGEIS